MKNVKAVAASAAMVMAAALGTGSLLAWQQTTAAAPTVTQPAPTEIVVEYVDAPVAEIAPPAAPEMVVPAGASTSPVDGPEAMSEGYEDHEEYEEYEEYEDGDDDD